MPVARDVDAPREPDALLLPDVVDEASETERSAGMADDAAVEPDPSGARGS